MNRTLTVAGTTTSVASSVTVNSQPTTRYDDDTSAKDGFSLSDGNNTFEAVAQDGLSRQDSHSITVYLPATASYSYDDNGNLLLEGADWICGLLARATIDWNGKAR